MLFAVKEKKGRPLRGRPFPFPCPGRPPRTHKVRRPQGLSTGVPGELAKLDKREEQQTGREAELVLRVAPRPVFLAGREALLAELDARLTWRPGAAGGGAVRAGGRG